jgi:hypothetical protein
MEEEAMIMMPRITETSLAQAPVPPDDQSRKREMAMAWKAIKGELPDPLVVDKGDVNDNVKPNRIEPIVAKGQSALFGKELKIEATNETTEPDAKVQTFLDRLWGDEDNKMIKLCKMAINGGAFGQVFLKLIPSQDPGMPPRIINLNPRIMRIVTDPEDCELHIAYIIEYLLAGDLQKRQIIARIDPNLNDWQTLGFDLQDYWTITTYTRKNATGERWAQIAFEEWPYSFAPIHTCQNLPDPNEAWGRPDATQDLIRMNEAINFLCSNIQRIIKYHGHMKTWVKGVNPSQITAAIDETVVLDSPDAEMGTLAPMTEFAGLLSVLTDLRADMDEQSRIPAVAQGRIDKLTGLGTISGVALKLMFQSLIDKTTEKQRAYGALIRNVSRASLVLAGIIPPERYKDYPIKLHWQEIVPVNMMESWQEAILAQQVGVSKDTLLRERGYDPEEEATKREEEQAQAVVDASRGRGFPLQKNQQGQEGGTQ